MGLHLWFIHTPSTIIWLPLSMPTTLLSTTTPPFTPTMLPLLSMLPLMSARTKVDNLSPVPMELLPDLLSMLWPMPPLWSPPLLLHLLPKLIPLLGIMDTTDIPMDIIMDMPDTTDIMDILTTDTVELDAETTSELWFPVLANKMCSN